MLTLTPSTWIISDTHWKHQNIIALCHRPTDCDARMVVNWQQLVKPTDDILHLGDLAVGLTDKNGIYETMLRLLKGRKFLIRGNHDKASSAFYNDLGFNVLDSRKLQSAPTIDARIRRTRVLRQDVLGQRLALSHVPLKNDGSWDLNLHGHVHNLQPLEDPRWVNVSVELRGYRPVRLRSVIGRISRPIS